MATQVITKEDALTADDLAAEATAEKVAAEAAFAAVDEPTAKPAVKPEPKLEPKPEKTEAERQAEAKAIAEDAAKAAANAEWEGVPAKVRQTLEGITAKVGILDKIEPRLKSVEGRTGAALEGVHAINTALEAAKAVTKEGGKAPTAEQIKAAAESDASWEALKEIFPDWSEGTDKRIDRKMDERLAKLAIPPAIDVAGLKTELTGTVSEIIAKATSEAQAEARELVKVDRKHESWTQDIYANGVDGQQGFTPEFAAWEAAQPPEIRALKNSNKAVDAIRMLDGFYDHRKAVAEATAKAERNKKRLDGAITPKGVATPAANRTISEEEARRRGFESVDQL